MQRQRNELVPVAEVIADLPGPVQGAPQNPTTGAAGLHPRRSGKPVGRGQRSGPDLGFMARMMALCSLPRTNPGNRLQYKRQNGPFTLYMVAGGGNKLPFGNFPRLLLAWVSTEAVRTQSRELVLGPRFPSSCGRWGSTAVAAAGGRSNSAPQPDEPAVWLHRLADL